MCQATNSGNRAAIRALVMVLIAVALPGFCLARGSLRRPQGTANLDQATILRVVEREITVDGRKARVFRIEQPDGTWGFHGRKGGRFRVLLENKTKVPTSVHWHGLILPNDQDGVPFVTQAPIPPGSQHAYDFELVQSGTYWMHSHYGLQVQKDLSAPLILTDPAGAHRNEQEVVMLLSDFSFKDPKQLWAGLRKKVMSGMTMPGMTPMKMGAATAAGKAPGSQQPQGGMKGMPGKSVGKPDLSDVAYDAYLTNYRTLRDPEVIRAQPGKTVRLRIINGAAGTNFFIHLGPLRGEAIAVDGEPIAPLPGSTFELGMAQRIDIRVTLPNGQGAYPILAQGEGTAMQTGLLLVTPGAGRPSLSERASRTAGSVGYGQELRLRAAAPLPRRVVDRTLTVLLEGDMASYVWKLNGQVWPDVTPLMIQRGERVEMVFQNKTGMSHPMHLHGHVFQVTEINGTALSGAKRDTLLVMPNSTAKIQFDADNPGVWMMHCHVLYHERGGMLTTVNYQGFPVPDFGPRE
jgi:FtsP/CotA-like multicopper oxidase with cupredoxin domain